MSNDMKLFGGNMKNKQLWIKLILALIIVVMMVSLAACTKKPPVIVDPPPKDDEASLFEELINIIKSINPLVATVNGIEESSAVYLDAGIGADYKFSANEEKGTKQQEGNYSIGLKGNVKATSPEVQLTIQDNKNTSDKDILLLAYKDKFAYIKQPLTAVNTVNKTETTKADLTNMAGNIDTIMSVAMYKLAGISININFDELGEKLESTLKGINLTEDALSDLIQLTKTESGNKLTIPATSAKTIITSIVYPMAVKTDEAKAVVNTVINTLFNTDKGFEYIKKDIVFPNIFIETTIANNALTSIKLGIDYEKVNTSGDYALLYINLNKLATSGDPVTITAPSYQLKTLQVGVGANVYEKGVAADLKVNITGNMVNDTSTLVNAVLNFSNNALNGTVNGFYNGSAAFFDIKGAFDAVGQTAKDAEVYSANYNMYEKMTAGLEDWSFKVKNPPAKVEKPAGLSIFQQIFKALGGDMGALVPVDGVTPDPTAQQMLNALKDKFGDNVRFNIPTTGYADLITVLSDQWNNNKDTIKTIIREDAPWAEVTSGSDWIGNLFLTKNGENNDLLDIVNIFLCNGKNDGTPIDILSSDLTSFVNRYIALLALSDSELADPNVAIYKDAVKKLDDELLFYKNQFKANTITEEVYNQKVKDHNEKLKFANGIGENTTLTANYFADLVLKEFFGYTSENSLGSDYLAEFINSGVTVKVTCKKDGGLNGGIELWGKIDTTAVKYVRIDGFIKIIEKDTTSGVFEPAGPSSLTDGTDGTTEKYRKIAKWPDGTKKLNLSTSTAENLTYIYIDSHGNETPIIDDCIFEKQYVAVELLQENLWNLLEYYKDIVKE